MTKLKESKEKIVYLSLERTAKNIREQLNSLLISAESKITIEQWLTLKTISDNQGISQKSIALKISKDKASISRLIKKLKLQKLITIKKNPKDQKANKLFLTPEGFEFVSAFHTKMEKIYKSYFHGIHEKELNLIVEILKRVNNN